MLVRLGDDGAGIVDAHQDGGGGLFGERVGVGGGVDALVGPTADAVHDPERALVSEDEARVLAALLRLIGMWDEDRAGGEDAEARREGGDGRVGDGGRRGGIAAGVSGDGGEARDALATGRAWPLARQTRLGMRAQARRQSARGESHRAHQRGGRRHSSRRPSVGRVERAGGCARGKG